MNWYGPRSLGNWLLAPVAVAYGAMVRGWHFLFDVGLRRPVRVEGVTVVSVGNLVVGGAGKTPVVIHLANEAIRRGFKVAVLSRGYGRIEKAPRSMTHTRLLPVKEVGDEPRLIARRCPGVTVWVGADRVALARSAAVQGAELLILDDGFQHRRLARDIDVLVDAGEGNGLLLPAGPLREPSSGRRRATHVWGRDGMPGDVQAMHQITSVQSPRGERVGLDGRRVVLLLGVARPDLVQKAVQALGAVIVGMQVFADHHVFSAQEVSAATAEAERKSAWLVTTEKDAERLPEGTAYVLVLDVSVIRGELPLPQRRTL